MVMYIIFCTLLHAFKYHLKIQILIPFLYSVQYYESCIIPNVKATKKHPVDYSIFASNFPLQTTARHSPKRILYGVLTDNQTLTTRLC